MRILLGVAALTAFGVVAVGGSMRFAPVQDALFDRALSRALAPRQAALFDGDGLKVVFCGTGSPLPSKIRAQACTAIIAGDKVFLVDVGTGSWETLQAAGVPGETLAAIFLTHFHTDHIGDMSEANLGSWIAGRPGPLPVYGPEGAARVAAGENDALALDHLYRTAHHGKAIAAPRSAGFAAIEFDGASPTVVYEADGLKVTAFPVRHDPVKPAVGYRFDFLGRSVVVSGDTAYSESLIENARGADLLVHEAQANHMVAKMQAAAAENGNARLAKVLADIPSYHTSPEEAARAANEAGAEWLVLTHLTPAPDNAVARRIFMRGVSRIRRDRVRMAEDGMVILLSADGEVTFSAL
jgi:ribonuclease Z